MTGKKRRPYAAAPGITKEPVCDCCLQPFDRLWIYPHCRFEMLFVDQLQDYKAGWWAFCVYCHALFVKRDFRTLAARVITITIPDPRAAAATHLFELLYQTLAEDALLGEGVLWEAGQDRGPRRFPCPPPGAEEKEPRLMCLICGRRDDNLAALQEHVCEHGYALQDHRRVTRRETKDAWIFTMPDGVDWMKAKK